jgi:hypothetical protein
MAEYFIALLNKLNVVSSRQFCFSQGSHNTPEIGKYSLHSFKTPSLLT